MDELHRYVSDDPKYWPLEHTDYTSPFDIIDKALSSRIYFLQDSLLSTNALLQQRNSIRNRSISEFDDRMRHIQYLLFQMDSLNLPLQAKSSLEAQMNSILCEKYREEVSNWRDSFMVHRELLKTEKELRTAIQDLCILRILGNTIDWNSGKTERS